MDIIDYATLKTKDRTYRFESRRDIRDKVTYATTDSSGFELDVTDKKEAPMPTFGEYVSAQVKGLLT